MAQELKKAHYCKLFEVCDFSALVYMCMWIWGRGILINDNKMFSNAENCRYKPCKQVLFQVQFKTRESNLILYYII